MSYCFNCGDSNAKFKRNVQTGKSVGYSNGNTYRNTHFGDRFLCESCAFNYDKNKLDRKINNRIVFLFFLIIFVIYITFI